VVVAGHHEIDSLAKENVVLGFCMQLNHKEAKGGCPDASVEEGAKNTKSFKVQYEMRDIIGRNKA
jgi:hypothetical protein